MRGAQRLGLALLALLTLLAGLAGSGCQDSTDGPAATPLSILLVTLDTVRADYLGCYNPARRGLTPHLDALAQEGILFGRCYSASAITPSSHATILTGLYPHNHGLRVIYAPSGRHLNSEIPYLPLLLQAAGWHTAAFLSAFTVSDFYGFARGFDQFDAGLARPAAELIRGRPGTIYDWMLTPGQRRSDATTDRALSWLAQLDPQQPFFLWVHYWDPHDASLSVPSTIPPEEFLAPYLSRAEPTEVGRLRAIYAAEIAYVDLQFARLRERLRELGRDGTTLIVVVADHGEGLGEHDWWSHGILYEEQLHVPLIVRIPDGPAGRRIPAVTRTVDILPTVLEILGLDPDGDPAGRVSPAGLAGRSLMPLLEGRSDSRRVGFAEALNEFDQNSRVPLQRPSDCHVYCVVDGDWKLLWHFDRPRESELYNLADDPDEARNLYGQQETPALRLQQTLAELDPFRTVPFGGTPQPDDDAARRTLESLGYIGERRAGQKTQPSDRR